MIRGSHDKGEPRWRLRAGSSSGSAAVNSLCQRQERRGGNQRWLSLRGAAPRAQPNPGDLIPTSVFSSCTHWLWRC